ncbi:MAG: hypothetical protein IPJ74_13565 [Saprospiraceae bacterium]|nr:hypothetical protein [Saprospiraceae bacterium]
MSHRPFFAQLSLITLIVALVLGSTLFFSTSNQDKLFSWLTLLFFVILTIGMYFIANQAVKSKNKSRFIALSMGFTLSKMVLCVAIAVAYRASVTNVSNRFVFILLGIYVVYTIFETYFLMKLSKIK